MIPPEPILCNTFQDVLRAYRAKDSRQLHGMLHENITKGTPWRLGFTLLSRNMLVIEIYMPRSEDVVFQDRLCERKMVAFPMQAFDLHETCMALFMYMEDKYPQEYAE